MGIISSTDYTKPWGLEDFILSSTRINNYVGYRIDNACQNTYFELSSRRRCKALTKRLPSL